MKLKVVASEHNVASREHQTNPFIELQASLDRAWKPGDFDALRIERTEKMINACCAIEGKTVCDLGTGTGEIAQILQKMGALVTAADGTRVALKRLDASLNPTHALLPKLPFKDKSFDVLCCFDVIAEIPEKFRRLALFELSRTLKDGGKLLISTPLDVSTYNPLGAFLELLATEFEPETVALSFHRLYIQLQKLFLNFKLGKKGTLFFEKISEKLWDLEGASHAIVALSKKDLTKPESSQGNKTCSLRLLHSWPDLVRKS